MDDIVWKKCIVADIAAPQKNALVGGPFGSNLVSRDYTPFGVPVIRGQNMGFGRWIGGEFVFVSSQKADVLISNIAKPGDLIFTQRGTLGQVAIVPPKPYDTYVISQSQMKLSSDKLKADVNFLYYLFTSPEQQEYIKQNTIQTGVPHTNLEHLRNTPLSLPPLSEQQKIARILGSLDDKIELNRQMNETLEAMARAIFQSWFVDFEPVQAKAEGRQPAGMDAETAALFPSEMAEVDGREVPKGWGIGKVSDLGNIICGKTPPTKDPENYGNDMLFITIPDMHNQIFVINTSKKLSKTGIQTQSNKTLPPMSICVSCIASPGIVILTTEPSQTNQQINSVIPFNERQAYYCYYALMDLSNEIKSSGSGGSVIDNLNKADFSDLSILIPSEQVIENYYNQVHSLFSKILLNQKESRTLAHIRDALLPKLMSGELRINELP